MIKKLKLRVKQFKELNTLDKLLVVVLFYLMGRVTWPIVQILYTVISNIIKLHG